jgi:hypothetical protein
MKSRRISSQHAADIAQKIVNTRMVPMMAESVRLNNEVLSYIRSLIVNNPDIESAAQAMSKANPFLLKKVDGCEYSHIEFQNDLRVSARRVGSEDFTSYSSCYRLMTNCIDVEIYAEDGSKRYRISSFQLILEPGESAWTPAISERQISLAFPLSHPVVALASDYYKSIENSRTSAHSLYRELRSNIERAGTTSRLIELWPEVKQIVLDHFNEVEHVEVPLDSIINRHVHIPLAAPAA